MIYTSIGIQWLWLFILIFGPFPIVPYLVFKNSNKYKCCVKMIFNLKRHSVFCFEWYFIASELVTISAFSDSELSYLEQEKDVEALSEASSNPKICTLCESLISQAVEYFADNQTQSEIIGLLRQTCGVAGVFKEEV